MKTLKDFLEARMIATGDFRISASGRKVRRLIKVGDDDYSKAKDIDNDGDNDENDEKAKKMRGESVEQVEECIYKKDVENAFPASGVKTGQSAPKGTSTMPKDKQKAKGIPAGKLGEEVELEEAVSVKKANYSWGKMITVHHGADTSYPLHPEHQAAIKKLKDGEKTSFKDETNSTVQAHREGDNVHLTRPKTGSTKTTVAHSHFNESTDLSEEVFVHVSDGSKYDEEPHPKDVEHVQKGAAAHGGKFDGHSDKGAYFKFGSHSDAQHFKKHVDSCPHRTCYADIHESIEQVTEAIDKQDARLLQLARLGLLDKADIALFRTAMQTLKADKQLSIKQRNLLLSVYESLVNLVTGDDALFNRTKIDIQRESTEQLDEISKQTLASYIPKAAKDARIHGQIATDFEARGKTARKSSSKQAWSSLSQKYKEKAWKRDDGITKAVNKLTKEQAEQQAEGYYKDIDTNEKEDKRLGSWKVETPWKKVGADTVTDKSGAKHTPMSRVRHLARLAIAKNRKEGK